MLHKIRTLIIAGMVCSFASCNIVKPEEKDDTTNLVALALLATPSSVNQVQNVVAVSTTTKSVTLSWDAYSGAVVYNVYYTCSTSTQASTLPAITTVTDPTIVTTTTGATTSNGIVSGTEACSASVVNIVKKADSPLVIPVKKLGLPYKFVVTAVTNGTTETTPSKVAELAEAAPTQAKRLRGIYMVGGLATGYSSPVAAVDLYDPDTSTWFPSVTTLPTPVSFAGIASEKSKIVVVGGFDSTGALPGKTQVYDVLTDTWSNKTAGPASIRANMGVSNGNGKIFFLGGTTVAAATAWAGSLATDIYDVNTDVWSVGTSYGALGSERSSVNVGGVLYNSGGRTAAAAVAVTHDGYTISANALTGVGVVEVPLTSARNGHSTVGYTSTTLGPEIWSIGGVTALTTQAAAGLLIAATTVYTPSVLVQSLANPFGTGVTWVATPPQLATATGFGTAVVDQRNGNVYYGGGNTNSVTPLSPTGVTTFLSSNIVTKPAWTTLTAMPNARWGHTAVIPVQ
jgi:hypothetical protein